MFTYCHTVQKAPLQHLEANMVEFHSGWLDQTQASRQNEILGLQPNEIEQPKHFVL